MPFVTNRVLARLGALKFPAPAWALALGLGLGGAAHAQPTPITNSTPAPVTTVAHPAAQIAPIGSFILHGRVVGSPVYRGHARISQSGALVTLVRAAGDEAEQTLLGRALARDHWVFPSGDAVGPAGERRWGTVTASRLNLRSGPGGNNPTRGQAIRGSKLLVVGESGPWLEILNRDGRRLWTHGGYVDVKSYAASGAAEVELIADTRGPWSVHFSGTTPLVVERFEETVNELILLGMGLYASQEVWDLRSVQGVKVRGILDSAEEDVIEAFGSRRDLSEDADVEGFLDDLGLSDAQRAILKGAIDSTGSDARDELGQMILTYWEAERGDRVLERMILSGHSVGSGVWGDENGSFSFQLLPKLNEAFPKAAAQVEDLMIAGCYSSSLRQVDRFRGWFPNLRSFWAYGDSAPGSWTGATIHNALWEEASRGHEPGLVSRVLARGTRKGDNVATWNDVLGYEADGPLRPLATISAELDGSQDAYLKFESGEEIVEDTQRGPLRDHYRLIQEILGHPELSSSEQAGWERARDATIRLIFYETNIRVRFQEVYGPEVAAGFTALGLTAPDWATISRAEAKAAILGFKQSIDLAGAPSAEVERALYLLSKGLEALSIEVVPNEWV
ncbi:MAG: SH3 domain-containing protein [Planctomycetes bacterium]|nr:SH3 domain-containing protein [Planctomycetota bacterium]